MAFTRSKRRNSRWSPGRKRPFRPRRGPGFARQKFDKIVLFNNLNAGPNLDGISGNAVCAPAETPSCSPTADPPNCGPESVCGPSESGVICRCCVTKANFLLVNNNTLQSFYQDSVTIVRMYGDIYYRAVLGWPFGAERCAFDGSTLNAYQELYTEAYAEQWHWNLRKHERTQSNDETVAADGASTMFNYDWTESSPPWLWQRNKMWFPKEEQVNGQWSFDSFLGICSDTENPGVVVPPTVTGNNPGWIEPPTVTNCVPMTLNEAGICPVKYNEIVTTKPPWHHLRLSSKKHIKMVRDQDLMLTCAVRHPQLSAAGGWPCIDKATFPTFLRAFDTSYQFYVRIAAVVRLN